MITSEEREQLKKELKQEILTEIELDKPHNLWRKFTSETLNPLLLQKFKNIKHLNHGCINAEIYKMKTAINILVHLGLGVKVSSLKPQHMDKAKNIAFTVVTSWESEVINE